MTITPLPWSRERDTRFSHDNSAGIRDAKGMFVATVLDHNRSDRDQEVEDTADFVVRACNSHDELVRVLQGLLDAYSISGPEQTIPTRVWWNDAREILAKAKG